MSMNGSLRRVIPELLESLLESPEGVTSLVMSAGAAGSEAVQSVVEQMRAMMAGGMAQQMDPAMAAQMQSLINQFSPGAGSADAEAPDGAGPMLGLDKAWHGLHYLLTGDAWGGEPPLAYAVLGDEELGEDLGYGPARCLTAEQVREVHAALSAVREDDLRTRFDPEALGAAEVYPSGAWDSDGDEEREWLMDAFRSLTAFYAEAAEAGDAMLMWVS